jgi:hypothetical protein
MGMNMKDEQVPLQMKILFGNHFFVHNGAHIKTHECPSKSKTTPRSLKLEVEVPFHHKNIQSFYPFNTPQHNIHY